MKTTRKLLAIICIAGLAGIFNSTCRAADPTPAPAPNVSNGLEWQDAGKSVKVAEILNKWMPPGYTDQSGTVMMRDGVKLATDVFLPPGGKPVCVVLCRTPYGRYNNGGITSTYWTNNGKYAIVVQDSRGTNDSQGKIEVNNENEIQDSYDTVDWIARQPWCNGRIGMTGGSGNGMCAAMAYLCKHPNLVVVSPGSTAGNTYPYWSYENGVRRWMYNWLQHRGLKTPAWPRPTLYEKYDAAKWQAIMDEAVKDNKTVYCGGDGWFNLFGDYSLDFFSQFASTGHVTMEMSTRTHKIPDKTSKNINFNIKEPRDHPAAYWSGWDFFDILEGKKTPSKSYLRYAVIGDDTDPGAPGNIWRYAEAWPPPSAPLSLYFTQDKRLVAAFPPVAKDAPPTAAAAVSYTYDPKDPAPTIGCCYSFGDELNGAYDQRPLVNRKDVIRFVSDPLAEPLEIGGKLRAELFISSDVQDTTFMVKFVDIYPDGQEIILRESAIMARYWDGVAHDGKPLQAGEIRKLAFPCNSMAAVFNKGHRIGIFITSSSTPAYEVHPNTWEPVDSIDKALVAHQTIYCEVPYASRVILPVTTVALPNPAKSIQP